MFSFTAPASDTLYKLDGCVDVVTYSSGFMNFSLTWTPPGKNSANTNFGMAGVMSGSSISTTSIQNLNQFNAFTFVFTAKASTTVEVSCQNVSSFNGTYTAWALLYQLAPSGS
jgi:hypothetical protein